VCSWACAAVRVVPRPPWPGRSSHAARAWSLPPGPQRSAAGGYARASTLLTDVANQRPPRAVGTSTNSQTISKPSISAKVPAPRVALLDFVQHSTSIRAQMSAAECWECHPPACSRGRVAPAARRCSPARPYAPCFSGRPRSRAVPVKIELSLRCACCREPAIPLEKSGLSERGLTVLSRSPARAGRRSSSPVASPSGPHRAPGGPAAGKQLLPGVRTGPRLLLLLSLTNLEGEPCLDVQFIGGVPGGPP
jgi:hypothetical protein